MAVTIEWMEYPVSLGSEAEEMTITWNDGSTCVVPAHDGDGETIIQLSRLMEEIFRVEYVNCFENQLGRSIDQFPVLFRSPSGVLVLRVMAEDSFLNAFICKSKDAGECLLSWINGDVAHFAKDIAHPPEGSSDLHWFRVKEVLAMIGAGLLDDIPPIVFDLDEAIDPEGSVPELYELTEDELPWWTPPPREGLVFAFPACLFELDSYVQNATIDRASETCVAVSVTHALSQEEWVHLLEGCQTGSIADRILNDSDGFRARFAIVSTLVPELGRIWLDRWKDLY